MYPHNYTVFVSSSFNEQWYFCRSLMKPVIQVLWNLTCNEVVVNSAGLTALYAETYIYCHITVKGCSSCLNAPSPPHPLTTHAQHTHIAFRHHTLPLTEFQFLSLHLSLTFTDRSSTLPGDEDQKQRESGLISVCRFLSSGLHSDPDIHRCQWPSCSCRAFEAARRQCGALLWTCRSLIEEPWEPHINHVLMYTALISQAVTCCQQVLLTRLFRAVMSSTEPPVWKWAKEHCRTLICFIALFFSFYLMQSGRNLNSTTSRHPMQWWFAFIIIAPFHT